MDRMGKQTRIFNREMEAQENNEILKLKFIISKINKSLDGH